MSEGAGAMGSGLANVLRGRLGAGLQQAGISAPVRDVGSSRSCLEEGRSCGDCFDADFKDELHMWRLEMASSP